MTEEKKLSRKEQLAEYRRQQRQKSPERMSELREKAAHETLRSRLTFWGIILCLAGSATLVINIFMMIEAIADKQTIVMPAIFIIWGIIMLGVGIADLISTQTKLLLATGIVTIVHGAILLLSLNVFWGPVMIIAGIMMLIDAKKAFARKKIMDAEQGNAG